jgi:hypothetical protein
VRRHIPAPEHAGSWTEYGRIHGVYVDTETWTLCCRRCGAEWPVAHYRYKRLLKHAHVCPNLCNGKKRTRRTGNLPAMVEGRQRARWERSHGWQGEDYAGPVANPGDHVSRPKSPEAKREQREWFAKVRAGWRPPTAEERRQHVEEELWFLEEVGELPDPMRAIFASEQRPGEGHRSFLSRWLSRDWD